MEENAGLLFRRLERLEGILTKLESNTRPGDHEPRPVRRCDVGEGQVTVHIRCNVIQVGDIKNVEQEFTAEYFLAASYLEPALRGVQSADDVEWDSQWDPRIVFPTALGFQQMIKKVLFSEDGRQDDVPMVVKTYRFIGTFKEKLELDDFPLDSQALTLVVMSDWPQTDIKLVEDLSIKDSINISNFTGSQTWELMPHVNSGPIVVKRDATSSHRSYPTFHITCHVVRRVGFYFWNIAFVMALIMGLTFASFAIPATETGDRLGVTVTLLLTAVAFKFVVSQNLPTISYLTLLDIYVLMCMIIQVLIAIQNSVSSLWSGESQTESARLFDMVSALVLGGFVILFHIIFGMVIILKVRSRNQELHANTKKYLELCDKINEAYQKRKKCSAAKKNEREIKSSGNKVGSLRKP